MDGETALSVLVPLGAAISPDFRLLGRALVGLGMGDVLPQEQQEIAVHSKGVGGMQELGPIHGAGAIFPVKLTSGWAPCNWVSFRHAVQKGVSNRVLKA